MMKGRFMRGKVFKEELAALKERKYIDELDYVKIKNAYNLYLQDLETHEREFIKKQASNEQAKKVTKPAKIKPALTPEKIRERNISWLLILGVILLFIGGLVFGTSNWASMGNLVKVLLVSLVSIVFFASSHITEKYLRIHKTAFAFMTLGSLFVPITFVSIGFFQLLGAWLSIYGEGRYLLGFIGSLVCFLLYAFIAKKYKHRLFVWFTYLSATIGVGFLLAMTYLPRDFFYLGIMLYNALLLLGYYKLKHNQHLALFMKELPLYSQLNLILSTLLMLFFFENATFYSFNILLTAVLYIFIVFVNHARQYHYVFTVLFVYGMYQLIQNSFLESFDYIGFAMIGLLYLLFQQYAAKEEYLQKAFQLTSGIISFFAFIFISVQGILLRSNGDSAVLLIAYLIIAVNYICLANISKRRIFQYLAPCFLVAAGLQSYYVLFKGIPQSYVQLYMFTIAAILYFVLFLKNQFKYFAVIKTSSFYVSIGTMLLSILAAALNGESANTAILFLAFGFISLFTFKANEKLKKIAAWVNPISWGLSLISFFDFLNHHAAFYGKYLGLVSHLAISGIILLAISYFWRFRKQPLLDLNTFLTAAAVYSLSIFTTVQGIDGKPIMVSGIYFAGIVIYVLLVYKVNMKGLWTIVSITSLLFLTSLAAAFKIENNAVLYSVYNTMIPVLLLLVYEFIGRKIHTLKPYFFWTAHVYLLGVFIFDLFYISYEKINPAMLFIPLGAYIYSTFKQKNERKIKLFLYTAFTTLPFIVYLTIIHYRLDKIFTNEYLLLIVSALIGSSWLLMNEIWKKRIEWYLIPQSILGLIIFIPYVSGQNFIQLALFMGYTVFTLYLLHRRKWQLYTILPLMAVIVYMASYVFYLEKWLQLGLVLLIFFALHIFGRFTYKLLINSTSKPIQIDWYTIVSWGTIIMLMAVISGRDPLWMKLIPSVLIFYSLYSLIHRFTGIFEKRMIKTLTAVSILLPYYTTLREFAINQYIVTELYTLPFIALTIYLSRTTWKDYKKIMNAIQWVVLVIVTSILVTDALQSNTIYDAIIIGILSLISILGGIHYRIKSYFFVGICVLLLNVFLQTRPYWGNAPWWIYLIIAGITLISFASYYELQKKSPDKKSFFQLKKEQFINKFKDWD